MKSKDIQIINVSASYDDRGDIVYCNDFNFIQKKLKDFTKLLIII